MPFVWTETRVQDGIQFSGWDPYSKPSGEAAFDWIVVLSPILVIAVHFFTTESPRQFPYFWSLAVPFSLYFVSSWLRSYRFTVSRDGYRSQRFWFGIRWFDHAFPAGTVIAIEEDYFEPGITGIYVADIHFGRGKHAEELFARIKKVATEKEVWSGPVRLTTGE